MESKRRENLRLIVAVFALAAVALSSTGCGMIWPTRARRGEVGHTGFLGNYAQLKPHEGYEAQEVYINPSAAWSKYSAFYIESVSMWVNQAEAAKLNPEDQQMITDMLYKALRDKLGEKFKLADHPGPGVIKLRAALTQVKGAKVALNAVTTVIPQLRVVSTLAGTAADTAALVGSASVEAEATDSITNERLGAAISARAGTKGLARAFSKWADVQAICDVWAERMRDFFAKQGVRQRT
jgi:hypothetical protein